MSGAPPDTPEDPRRHSPAAERNRAPILAVLQRLLPAQAQVLEIASGSGQHAAYFAAAMPGWRWHPSDADPAALASIRAWCAEVANVEPPLELDVTAPVWPGLPEGFDAIYCANMLHASPPQTLAGLVRGASRHLAAGGRLLLYGPFLVAGEPVAQSNLAFDADLRARDPRWGLRPLAAVVAAAEAAGLRFVERIAMPSNNHVLVFARA